jgi:hypothetical protein
MNEDKALADKYKNKSIAEQNSLDIAWEILQRPQFDNLRCALFASQDDVLRFRQLVVNGKFENHGLFTSVTLHQVSLY